MTQGRSIRLFLVDGAPNGVKYLESQLIAQAKHAGRCGLVNSTAHTRGLRRASVR